MIEEHFDNSLWENYIKLYESFWVNSEYQKTLLKSLNNKVDIAQVIYGILEMESHIWIEKIIPALGNMKPINCIDDEILFKRLKTMLTRMSR